MSSRDFEAEALISEARRYVYAVHGTQSFHRRRNASRHVELSARAGGRPIQPSFAEMVDPENLLRVYRARRSFAGAAPGLDELTWDNFSIREAGRAFRTLSQMIQNRTYLPQPPRPVDIPKPDGDYRRLLLRSILDRTISAAVLERISPLGEALFLPGLMAYRRNRSVHLTIALLATWIERYGRFVVAQADIRKAFDNVPIRDAVLDYQHLVADADLRWLIGTILRGHEGEARTIGIDQGDPLSPFALNLRLHAATDLSLQRAADTGGPLWLRFADNYLLLCQSDTEGRESISRLANLLRGAGLELKATSIHITDLRREGAWTEVLGFSLSLGAARRVEVAMGTQALRGLRDALELAHLEAEPSLAAEAVLIGWLRAVGPALGDVGRSEQVLRMATVEAARCEHRELRLDRSRQATQDARTSWHMALNHVRHSELPFPPQLISPVVASSATRLASQSRPESPPF